MPPSTYRESAAEVMSGGVPLETRERPTLKSQFKRLRQEIQGHGESTVGGDESRVSCPDEFLLSTQWNAIARIAMSEGWSVTYISLMAASDLRVSDSES
jgi:hypothetical protein